MSQSRIKWGYYGNQHWHHTSSNICLHNTQQQKQNTETRFCWLYGMLGAYTCLSKCTIHWLSISYAMGQVGHVNLRAKTTLASSSLYSLKLRRHQYVLLLHIPQRFPPFLTQFPLRSCCNALNSLIWTSVCFFFPPPFLPALGDTSDT